MRPADIAEEIVLTPIVAFVLFNVMEFFGWLAPSMFTRPSNIVF